MGDQDCNNPGSAGLKTSGGNGRTEKLGEG